MTKTERIDVRCTEDEKEQWKQKAGPMTLSQYVRWLLDEAPKVVLR